MSRILKVKKTTLKGTLSTTALSMTVQKFVDSKDVELVTADFNGNFVVVITQGTNIEMLLCTAITQNGSDDTAILTIDSSGRHLNPQSPWTGGATGIQFTTGASVIVTNDPYTMSRLGNIDYVNTWALLQTFTVMPKSSDVPTDNDHLINKLYADALVLGTLTTLNVIVPAIAGEAVASGNLVYYDITDKEWKLCDADTASTVENVMLAIAQGTGTNGNDITGGVLLRGMDTKQSGMTSGDFMYASNTAGAISSSAGTKEVTVGVAKSATDLYFNPRFNQMLTEDQQDALVGTSGTPSSTNKYVTDDDTTGTGKVLRASEVDVKFGGTGADGALVITSGTTTIDLGGVKIFQKNYSSISITGTGKLAFTNPHANGTIIFLKATGNVTLTSSTAPMIDASGMGASGGAGGAGTGTVGTGNVGINGLGGILVLDDTNDHRGNNGAGAGSSGGGLGGSASAIHTNLFLYTNTEERLIGRREIKIACGNGGGGGASSSGNPSTSSVSGAGGAGNSGGGALVIECFGSLDFTTANGISVNGLSGSNGLEGSGSEETGGGGGGGGSAGMCVILYNSLTAKTGTITEAGGAGGNGGDANGASSSYGGGGAGGGGASISSAGGAGGNGGGTSSNGVNGGNGGTGAGGGGGGGAGNGGGSARTGGTGGTAGATDSNSLMILNTIFS